MCFIVQNGKFLTIPKRYQHFSYFCPMHFFKEVFNFYINSSIHVALAVFSLSYITLLELEVSYAETVLSFVFYAAISGYNFVKYFGIAKFHHRQLASRLKWIQILSFFCFLLMCFYAIKLQLKTFFLLIGFGMLTVFYAMPFLSKSIRDMSGLKVYAIAFVWAGTTVLLPVINEELPITSEVVVMFIQRFLYVLVLMLPFEIRDLKYDKTELRTIPQILGVIKTKILGLSLLVIFLLLEYFKARPSLTAITITVMTTLFLWGANERQPKYYSSFWVESLPIIWLAMILIFD